MQAPGKSEMQFRSFWHAQSPYLGQRIIDDKGKARRYHWMTYGEVAKVRTDIGSGLLHYGLKSGCTMGLYAVNSRGAAWLSCQFAKPSNQ